MANNNARLSKTLDALREETQRLESLYQRKLAALDELKKSLLHRAFTRSCEVPTGRPAYSPGRSECEALGHGNANPQALKGNGIENEALVARSDSCARGGAIRLRLPLRSAATRATARPDPVRRHSFRRDSLAGRISLRLRRALLRQCHLRGFRQNAFQRHETKRP